MWTNKRSGFLVRTHAAAFSAVDAPSDAVCISTPTSCSMMPRLMGSQLLTLHSTLSGYARRTVVKMEGSALFVYSRWLTPPLVRPCTSGSAPSSIPPQFCALMVGIRLRARTVFAPFLKISSIRGVEVSLQKFPMPSIPMIAVCAYRRFRFSAAIVPPPFVSRAPVPLFSGGRGNYIMPRGRNQGGSGKNPRKTRRRSFGEAEKTRTAPGTPELKLKLTRRVRGMTAKVTVRLGEQKISISQSMDFSPHYTEEKTAKMVCGAAVVTACGQLLGYRPSWGMLTGVRPSKVATDLLRKGISKTRVKRILTTEYFVIPKKAALATDVALNEQRIIGTPGKRDCSIYISIPFCPTRCSYCSFVSYTSKKLLSLIPDYLVRLHEDIRAMFANIRRLGLNVRTIYIGGGTPTILDERQLRDLLEVISRETDVSALEEFTLEAGRADTITAEKLAVARAFGVAVRGGPAQHRTVPYGGRFLPRV